MPSQCHSLTLLLFLVVVVAVARLRATVEGVLVRTQVNRIYSHIGVLIASEFRIALLT